MAKARNFTRNRMHINLYEKLNAIQFYILHCNTIRYTTTHSVQGLKRHSAAQIAAQNAALMSTCLSTKDSNGMLYNTQLQK